ncbi:beta-lactamase/transpeptidase-like protein [Cutaneotrichosporon oleaginosum]|uniref:Beta-lactamase/transpeptidase-like protein n=1 Tax=Cutaneotrichosporon oleaginosum TaxID=879819 RepID=A0A0J0XS57_9TREE|nr:beta-lactamase/transpeptidase-like protein [Cutaneotrichosporon oleaginosum]KLT43902.1 beta-lactamase/transpeptidase-like protein [Cutaneotrichosporon oleaginosum]TXT06359.1 hypothetical protein COLE_05690 [Cutaneotrichosporon oleaginosum]
MPAPAPTPKPAPKLTPEGKRALDAWFKAEVAKGEHPAMFAIVATPTEVLYESARGDRVFGQPEKGQVDWDTTLQLWSMTKLVTSVACLQLMERGLVDVDDPKLVEEVLPELAAQPILAGYDGDKVILKKRTQPLTLRHLLTHTSGSAYSFLGTPLVKWEKQTGHKAWTAKGAKLDSITTPLLFEPGTAFQYGHGIDWAGLLVERVSRLTLEDYFRKHIWSAVPGECRSMTFYPTRRTKGRMMGMHGRKGRRVVPEPGWRDVMAWDSMDMKFRFGGAGLFGTARDYTAFLQHLLACYQGREGMLRPETTRLLFEDAFPQGGEGDTCRKGLGRLMRDMGVSQPGWHTGAELTHSLAMCVNTADSPHGRRAGSATWGGVARTQQWIDPSTGIVAFFGTQILELDWRAYGRALDGFEHKVYGALEVGAKL